jgi:anti-anti-sigma regulatory factor
MKYRLEDAGDPVVLTLEGPLDIQSANELRDAFVAAAQGKNLVLDLGRAEAADVSALQLFCSLHRTMTRAGRGFAIQSPVSDAFRQSVADAGFQREHGCALDDQGTCLWSKGGECYE